MEKDRHNPQGGIAPAREGKAGDKTSAGQSRKRPPRGLTEMERALAVLAILEADGDEVSLVHLPN